MVIWINNRAQCLKTFYCHLSEFKVKTGDMVEADQLIGLSGNSGKYVVGSGHLHFGVYLLNSVGDLLYPDNGYKGAVDPLPYLIDSCEEGELIKLPSDNYNFPEFDRAKVYRIIEGKKYWIEDENTFWWMYNAPVSKAKIKEIDVLTYNYYKYGGRILNTKKFNS